MDFNFTSEQESFRSEVRSFIAENLPVQTTDVSDEGMYDQNKFDERLQFQKAMATKKWNTMAWPKKFGGLEAPHWQQMLLNEEMAYNRAPSGGNHGINWVGPALMLVGSEEQQKEHLNKIANADDDSWWCTFYSEPGAGSDLAALQTRAIQDGDEFVVNGQKIWTSGAHRSNWGWLAARTDPDAPKHRGISMFLLDLETPGITIRPLINMGDEHGFNEVFFEDVRLPKKNLVGEQDRGWYHLAVALDFERSSIAGFSGSRKTVEDHIQFADDNPHKIEQNPDVRLEYADRMIEIEIGTNLAYRIVHMQTNGIIANYEASAAKLFSSELNQRIARTGSKMLGLESLMRPQEPRAPLGGAIGQSYITSVSSTIGGGTSEIQRNIVATRGLGLPRG
jgi:alkylation response protein AidB-like acyl-CoA dehydrogenase